MVGAVIVKGGRVIGEGFHERVGGPHAEIAALRNVQESPAGAVMYVNLEPCCHHGRTPPCAGELVAAGLSQVVVGTVDPFHRVNGRGMAQLRAAGIQVRLLEDEALLADCVRLNRVFLKHARTGFPFVTMKYAMTLDGKIATRTGHSRWISSEASRAYVHKLRALHDGVMVGIGTALADDPQLTVRGVPGRDPVKIIVDSGARLPLTAKVLQGRVIVGATHAANVDRLRAAGVQVIPCAAREGRVDLTEFMGLLGKERITSILLEGGGTLTASLMAEGLIDRVVAFIAPVLVGGQDAPTPLEGRGVATMAEGWRLDDVRWDTCAADMVVEGSVVRA
jgi:diaminohydroxyphosphoribosylaminopyrimidine deaminase/5-amino-6-(5-phosphoribosylamino)uracil reductase